MRPLGLPVSRSDIDIFPYNAKRLMIAVTGKYPVCHFLRLVGHPMGFQSAGSNTYQVENIPVLADQRAIRLFWHFLSRFTAQAVVDIIG